MWKLALLLLLLLAGCSRSVEKGQVPGVYEFALDGLKQTIVVEYGGRYTNTLDENGVAVWTDQQTWTYETQSGDTGVTFTHFRFGIPGYASAPGLWFVVPSKAMSGSKKLCFDADLGRCFLSR